VHQGDGIAYLESARLPPDHAIITSLPDHSELPQLGVTAWKRWFIDTVALACRAGAGGGAVFFNKPAATQDGRWMDRGHLVNRGMEPAGSFVPWHKIVCRVPAGMVTFGRPAYAHMLCASRERRFEPGASKADVLPALGHMSWSRAMGTAACDAAIDFVVSAGVRVVVDPFCGQGSILAAANARGLDAVGVELSKRRAAKARTLRHEP